MSHEDVDTAWVPEEDRAEQQIPAVPEPEDADSMFTAHVRDDADEADVLEQATPLPVGDDDYPPAGTPDESA